MKVYSLLLFFLVAAFSFAAPVKVSFKLSGIDDAAVSGNIIVGDQWKSTSDGLVVFDLEPGDYTFSFSGGDNDFIIPDLNNIKFTVGSENIEINVFETVGLKKVKFIANGDLLKDIYSISYDLDLGDLEYNSELPISYNGTFLTLYHKSDFVDGEYVPSEDMFAYAYLLPGDYNYMMDSFDFIEENPYHKLRVNDGEDFQTVSLSFTSKEWHKSVFKIADKEGNIIEDGAFGNFLVEIRNSKGKRVYSSELQNNNKSLYLKNGDYSFVAYRETDVFKQWKNFSITGNGIEFVYAYSEPIMQDVSVSLINAAANEKYVISFYTNGFVEWSEKMLELTTDETGKASGKISLDEGTYDYCVFEPSSSYNAKIEVKEGVKCTIDLGGYKEYTIQPVDGNGNVIETEEGNIIVLYQNNKFVTQSYYPYVSNKFLLKTGDTYELWLAVSSFEYEPCLRSIVAGDEDKLDIELNNADQKYFIAFAADDDVLDFALSGRVVLEGTDLVPGLFFDYSYAYIFNVPEGEYNYTIDLDGYETIKGIVKVGPETADQDGYVEVDLDNLLSGGTTAIKDIAIKENVFSVYPSVVDDYIYISNKNTTQSVWSVSLYSASGTVVCRDRILPDSDTASVYVGNLDSGFYLMVIENETGRYTYKVMKR